MKIDEKKAKRVHVQRSPSEPSTEVQITSVLLDTVSFILEVPFPSHSPNLQAIESRSLIVFLVVSF